MKKTLAFLTKKHLYLGISRYSLGLLMLPYALSKIMKSQFILTGYAFTQLQSIEAIPGSTLAWAFLGRSIWFQILLGFVELVPSILLLFRKTTMLGAILMLPVTLNVFLINFALDLWPATKLISTALLCINILVLCLEWLKIKSMLSMILCSKDRLKQIKTETAINVIVISVVAYFIWRPVFEYRNERNELTGDWLNQRPVEWILEKEEVADSMLAYRDLKLYFGFYGRYDESGASTDSRPASYTIDTLKRTMILKYQGDNIVHCKYTMLSNEELRIDRLPDSAKGVEVTQYFRKRIINDTQE